MSRLFDRLSIENEKRICAFCHLPIKVYLKKDLTLGEGLLTMGLCGFFCVLLWGQISEFVFFAGLVVLGIMQIFVRMRWRASLICSHCGFDPLIYKKAPAEAARRVNRFIKRRNENPSYLLRSKPKIPKRIKKVKWSESKELTVTSKDGEESGPTLQGKDQESPGISISL